MRLVAFGLLLLLGSVRAFAEEEGPFPSTGDEFMILCEQKSPWQFRECPGYVAAVADSLMWEAAREGKACVEAAIPKGTAPDKELGIVFAFLMHHPEQRD